MAINTEWGNFAAPSSPFTDVSPPTAAQAQAVSGSAGDAPALSAGLKTVYKFAYSTSILCNAFNGTWQLPDELRTYM